MVTFQPIQTTVASSPWCVDGRPDYSATKGPQMLGGSLLPLVLRAIFEGQVLDSGFAKETFGKLSAAHVSLGVHRGEHKDSAGNKSDCGFSDRLSEIIVKAQNEREEIITRLLTVNQNHNDVLGSEEAVSMLLDRTFEKLSAYDAFSNIAVSGDTLIKAAEASGATTVNLTGDHNEQVAFVNTKPGTTLDTNGLNKSGNQAFNLDVWAVVEQAKVLGIDEGFATSASLILYQATEMVLVEAKGKPALPVVVHS